MPACKTVQPRIFATSDLQWSFNGIFSIIILIGITYLVNWRVRMNSWYLNCVALILLMVVLLIQWWNHSWNVYMFQNNAEPFYWNEGVSIWPSQLLRLLVIPFVIGFLIWGNKRIKTMQDKFQAQWGAKLSRRLPYQKNPKSLGAAKCFLLGIGKGTIKIDRCLMLYRMICGGGTWATLGIQALYFGCCCMRWRSLLQRGSLLCWVTYQMCLHVVILPEG